MTQFFHVRVEVDSKPLALALDLTFDLLQRKLIAPFHASRPFAIGGVTVEPSEVRKITVLQTDDPAGALVPYERQRLAEEHLDVSRGKQGDWVVLEGLAEDVTDMYIDVPAPAFQERLAESTEALLCRLVEAERSVSAKTRDVFVAIRYLGGHEIQHDGLAGNLTDFSWVDLDTLRQFGLILLHGGDEFYWPFTVSPAGIQYYQRLQQEFRMPAERLETYMRRYMTLEEFAARHPSAFAAWQAAEKALWEAATPQEFSAIGHDCREAVQQFADSLVRRWPCPEDAGDKTQTVARMRAVLDQAKTGMSQSVCAFLEALLPYWGTVVDLVQRQEHGANKESEELTWEDARRVVLQTAVVMFEIDRALSCLTSP